MNTYIATTSKISPVKIQCRRRMSVRCSSNGFNAHTSAVKKLAKQFQAQKEEYERRKKEHIRSIFSTIHTIVLDDIEFVKSVTMVKKPEDGTLEAEPVEPEVVDEQKNSQ